MLADNYKYKTALLRRPNTGSILRIEFKNPLTQIQIENRLEKEWDHLPGFEFYKLEGKIKT